MHKGKKKKFHLADQLDHYHAMCGVGLFGNNSGACSGQELMKRKLTNIPWYNSGAILWAVHYYARTPHLTTIYEYH